MKDIVEALRDTVSLLERLGAPYAVMGGLAVRVYGIPRPTYDIDITAAIDRSRLVELFQAWQALGYSVAEQHLAGWVDRVADMPLVKARLFLQGRSLDIDVFLSESLFQEQILARRRREAIEGLQVWLVSPEDLVLLKLLSFRPRDVSDIGDVLFTQGQLDEAYLRHWAERLGVLDRLENVLAQ